MKSIKYLINKNTKIGHNTTTFQKIGNIVVDDILDYWEKSIPFMVMNNQIKISIFADIVWAFSYKLLPATTLQFILRSEKPGMGCGVYNVIFEKQFETQGSLIARIKNMCINTSSDFELDASIQSFIQNMT